MSRKRACKPVTIGGVAYPSITAACEALGTHPRTVKRHVAEYGPDAPLVRKRPGAPGYPVLWDGVRYPSTLAAARALDLHPDTMRRYLDNGWTCTADVRKPGGRVGKPCTILGRTFPSQRAAAAHFQVAPSAISRAAQRGDIDKIAAGWLEGKRSSPLRPIRIGPLHYASVADAARALGVSWRTALRWSESGVDAHVIARLRADGRRIDGARRARPYN